MRSIAWLMSKSEPAPSPSLSTMSQARLLYDIARIMLALGGAGCRAWGVLDDRLVKVFGVVVPTLLLAEITECHQQQARVGHDLDGAHSSPLVIRSSFTQWAEDSTRQRPGRPRRRRSRLRARAQSGSNRSRRFVEATVATEKLGECQRAVGSVRQIEVPAI